MDTDVSSDVHMEALGAMPPSVASTTTKDNKDAVSNPWWEITCASNSGTAWLENLCE